MRAAFVRGRRSSSASVSRRSASRRARNAASRASASRSRRSRATRARRSSWTLPSAAKDPTEDSTASSALTAQSSAGRPSGVSHRSAARSRRTDEADRGAEEAEGRASASGSSSAAAAAAFIFTASASRAATSSTRGASRDAASAAVSHHPSSARCILRRVRRSLASRASLARPRAFARANSRQRVVARRARRRLEKSRNASSVSFVAGAARRHARNAARRGNASSAAARNAERNRAKPGSAATSAPTTSDHAGDGFLILTPERSAFFFPFPATRPRGSTPAEPPSLPHAAPAPNARASRRIRRVRDPSASPAFSPRPNRAPLSVSRHAARTPRRSGARLDAVASRHPRSDDATRRERNRVTPSDSPLDLAARPSHAATRHATRRRLRRDAANASRASATAAASRADATAAARANASSRRASRATTKTSAPSSRASPRAAPPPSPRRGASRARRASPRTTREALPRRAGEPRVSPKRPRRVSWRLPRGGVWLPRARGASPRARSRTRARRRRNRARTRA